MAMQRFRSSIVGGALLALLALSGCAADSAPASTNTGDSGADLYFLAMMTPHHARAVEMSDVQTAEVTQMHGLLAS